MTASRSLPSLVRALRRTLRCRTLSHPLPRVTVAGADLALVLLSRWRIGMHRYLTMYLNIITGILLCGVGSCSRSPSTCLKAAAPFLD